MKITVLWHIDDCFYNIRVSRGMKTISQSTMRMRHKIYNVDGVNWKFHIVLTLNEENVKKYENVGIDSKILRTFLTKVKKIFPEEKHFWKYEEGRESKRPHFHMLFDLKDKIKDKSDEILKVIDVGDIHNFVDNQKDYVLNRKKSDLEIVMGYFMFKLWGNGIAHARSIKSELELIDQVEKDVAKRTGVKGFKENSHKFGFSRGVKVKKDPKPRQYDYVGNVDTEGKAMEYLESTKDNFIDHFDNLEYDGSIIFDYTVSDIKDYCQEENRKEKGVTKEQVAIDEF